MKIYTFLLCSILIITGTISDGASTSPVYSQNQKEGYAIGDIVNNFALKNLEGDVISLSNLLPHKGLIIVFTNNHCPFAKAYADRIALLNEKFDHLGYKVVAINPGNSNVHEEDSILKMTERASKKGLDYLYLLDDRQEVAKTFGAKKTPQAYVLQKQGAHFIVKYMGMIDNNPQDAAAAYNHYLSNAVSNLLEGKPVETPFTKPIGCAIKVKN